MKNDFSASAEYYDLVLDREEIFKSAKFIIKILKKYNVKSILEIGCGTGLYLVPLKKAGFYVEGLDISKPMLDLAGEKSKIKLYLKDMSSFRLDRKFDSILNLNSSLILLKNFKLVEKTIKNVSKHINDNGIFLIDLPNHDKEIKENNNLQEKRRYKIRGGYLEVNFFDYKRGNKWISEWSGVAVRSGKYEMFKERYEELIFSPKKMERFLEKCGFEILDIFGSRKGGRFDKTKSLRRFYFCRKR